MNTRLLTTINPTGGQHPTGLYSHAVKVSSGDLLFVSGQTSWSEDGDFVGEGDIATQTRQVFHNLGVVLRGSGTDFNAVIEFTTYLVGVETVEPFLETRTEVFRDLYPNGVYPGSTLINISSLGGSKALVEISATAVVPAVG